MIAVAQRMGCHWTTTARAVFSYGRTVRWSRAEAYSYTITGQTLSLSSMDSDLEAFSHNPTDGSFSPLAFQLSENTNYLNQRFLSY